MTTRRAAPFVAVFKPMPSTGTGNATIIAAESAGWCLCRRNTISVAKKKKPSTIGTKTGRTIRATGDS